MRDRWVDHAVCRPSVGYTEQILTKSMDWYAECSRSMILCDVLIYIHTLLVFGSYVCWSCSVSCETASLMPINIKACVNQSDRELTERAVYGFWDGVCDKQVRGVAKAHVDGCDKCDKFG